MLLSFISFVGLFAGLLLAIYTKEELKSGEKYFTLLTKVILATIIFVLLYYTKFNLLFLFIGAIIGYFVNKIYLYLGMSVIISYVSKEFNILTVSLVFLFGLPYGTLLKYYKMDKLGNVLLSMVLFLLPLLLLINNYYMVYSSALSSIAVGGIFSFLVKNGY